MKSSPNLPRSRDAVITRYAPRVSPALPLSLAYTRAWSKPVIRARPPIIDYKYDMTMFTNSSFWQFVGAPLAEAQRRNIATRNQAKWYLRWERAK